MADIIIEAHRTSPSQSQSTIAYLTNFTNQQKVAERAMFGIAMDSLDRCQQLADIIALPRLLDWLPKSLKQEHPTFSNLLEVSQNIQAALDATTAYNRLELFSRPLRDLQMIQANLGTGAQAKDSTVMGPIVQSWQKILDANQCVLQEAAQQSPEHPNPFIPSDGLEPEFASERFKGRQEIFQKLERLALSAQAPTLLLYGRRKNGKSSSLKYLPRKVTSNLCPLLVDFQGAALSQNLANIVQFMASEIQNSATQSGRSLTIPDIDRDAVKDDPFFALQNWMEIIEQQNPGKTFLLCLDDFERLDEIIQATNRTPLNFFRYTMQHRKRWILLFSGSHRLHELPSYWSDCFIATEFVKLTYLKENEARDLICHPVSDFPEVFTADAVNTILHWTRGQPFLVQLTCSTVIAYISQVKK